MANGPYSKPKLPGIPGIERVRGAHLPHEPLGLRVHRRRHERRPHEARRQARRRYRYGRDRVSRQCPISGRDAATGLRVPAHAADRRRARQRAPTTRTGFARRSSPAGSERWRMDNFNIADGRRSSQEEDLVGDRWTELTNGLYVVDRRAAESRDGSQRTMENMLALIAERVDSGRWSEIRGRDRRDRRGSETANALKPWYRYLCKRPVLPRRVPAGLQPAERPRSSIRTAPGVDRITARGVVANGREYPLDCLIFATGFDVSQQLHATGGLRRSSDATVGS